LILQRSNGPNVPGNNALRGTASLPLDIHPALSRADEGAYFSFSIRGLSSHRPTGDIAIRERGRERKREREREEERERDSPFASSPREGRAVGPVAGGCGMAGNGACGSNGAGYKPTSLDPAMNFYKPII